MDILNISEFEVLKVESNELYGTQQPKKPKFGSGGFRTLSEVKLVD